MISTIGFDADDTLWHNGGVEVIARCFYYGITTLRVVLDRNNPRKVREHRKNGAQVALNGPP